MKKKKSIYLILTAAFLYYRYRTFGWGNTGLINYNGMFGFNIIKKKP